MYAHWILQAVEKDPKYWDVLSAALAVGWLDIVVCVVCKSFSIVVNTCLSEYKMTLYMIMQLTPMISEFWKYALNAWCFLLQVKLLRLHSSYQHNQIASREVSI